MPRHQRRLPPTPYTPTGAPPNKPKGMGVDENVTNGAVDDDNDNTDYDNNSEDYDKFGN